MRSLLWPTLLLLALTSCSEERPIAPPPGPSLCGKPLCEATCACDTSTGCDLDCNGCDPECGECRPASLMCSAPRDAGAGDGGDRPRGDGSVDPASDGGARRDAAVASECTTHAECGGRLCDRARGRCAECRTTDDCDSGQRCQDGACVGSTACQSDLTCTPMGLVCDAQARRCVECNSAAECSGAPCLGHSCVPTIACQSSLECAALHLVCGPALPPAWPAEFVGQGCGECNGVVDCAPGEACQQRLCTPVCAGRICGEVDGASCGTCPGGDCLESGLACFERVSLIGTQYFLDAGDRVFLGDDGRAGTGAILEVIGNGQPRLVTRAPANTYIDGLEMNSTNIFWALTNGEILTRARSGGLPSRFVTVPGTPTDTWCQALAADDSFVVCGLVDYGNSANSGLYRFPVGGGAGTRFDPAVQPSGLVIDGGTVFWALFNDGIVGKTEIATGRRTVLSREQGTLRGVVAGAAYFETTNDQLRRVPAGTTSAQTIARGHRWLGASSDALYLLDRSTDMVVRTQLDGSGRVEIARADELGIGQDVMRAFRRADGLYVMGESGTVRITP